MKHITIGIFLFCWGMASCDGIPDDDGTEALEATSVALPAPANLSIDKSQIYFFRQLPDGDTLFYHTTINGPRSEGEPHTFNIPAGYYRMVLIGNADTSHILFEGSKSSKNIIISYADGVEPPDLYYTQNYIKSGEQKKTGAGILILSVRIKLTIHQVPEDISRVDVKLENTASIIHLIGYRISGPTNPYISQSLHNIEAGSSPVLHIRSLPTFPSTDSSFLKVTCYNASGQIIYQGDSGGFQLGAPEDISIGCHFTPQKFNATSPYKSLLIPKNQLPDFILQKHLSKN